MRSADHHWSLPFLTSGHRAEPDETVLLAFRVADHAGTLRRLTARIDLLRQTCDQDFGSRLRASLLAYDQTLVLAAGDLGLTDVPPLPTRSGQPFTAGQRLALEAELALAGLRW